jgi:hypothetical protein
MKPLKENHYHLPANSSSKQANPVALPVAPNPSKKPERVILDPDLAFLIDAWPSLPEAIRQTILSLVRG